jgi:uncharacterized membrane protein
MNRHQLDAFTRVHRLSAPAVSAALELTGHRPDAAAWRAFAAIVLRATGVGSIGAGIVLFVAANWQDYGVFGRFALLQSALLLCVGFAMWRPSPQPIGQAALILATLLTGTLLALFGQSYQTGADLHELFFTWAFLSLPFALAGLSGALWAVWWTVLNIGLALLCGWLGPDHFFWRFVDGWGVDRSALLMLPCVVDLCAAGLALWIRTTRFASAAPMWLARFLGAAGMVYGTAAAMMASAPGLWRANQQGPHGPGAAIVFGAICLFIGVATWLRKRDAFPMAMIAASWIAISTTWIARATRFNDLGDFFVIAFWLIATSTGACMLLMHWVRTWRVDETPGADRQLERGVAA